MEPSFLYHSFGISRSNQLSKHLVSMVATESKYQEAWCSDSLKQTESFFLVIWDHNYQNRKLKSTPHWNGLPRWAKYSRLPVAALSTANVL